MDYPKIFAKSVAAGICIGIGTAVQLSCDNKYIGAFLFSIGLFYICCFKLNLYTGRVGYIIEYRNEPNILLIWLGNLIGSILCCIPLKMAKTELILASKAVFEAKISDEISILFIEGLFCGMIMFLAVDGFLNHQDVIAKYIGVLLSVPVFILCGFEHSIANMCYTIYAVTSVDEIKSGIIIILITSLANAIGAIAMNHLLNIKK